MAISAECKCTHNFTCGYCCRNAKPWLFTTTTTMHFFKKIPIEKKEPGDEKKEKEAPK
jgi:hypothetical protein